jgi:hypothetical protein
LQNTEAGPYRTRFRWLAAHNGDRTGETEE